MKNFSFIFILAITGMFFFISCGNKNKIEKNHLVLIELDTSKIKNLDEFEEDEYDIFKKKLFSEYREIERIAFIDYYIKRQRLLMRLSQEKGLSLELIDILLLSDEIPDDIASDKRYIENEKVFYEEFIHLKNKAYGEYSRKEMLVNKAQKKQKNKKN